MSNYQTYDGGTETPNRERFANLCTELENSPLRALPSFAWRDSTDPYKYRSYQTLMGSKGYLMGYSYEEREVILGKRADGSDRTRIESDFNQTGIYSRCFNDHEDQQLFLNTDRFPVSIEIEDMGPVGGTVTGYHLRCFALNDFEGDKIIYRGHMILVQRVYENDGKSFNHPTFDPWKTGTIRTSKKTGKPHPYIFEPVGVSIPVAGYHNRQLVTQLDQANGACRAESYKDENQQVGSDNSTKEMLNNLGLYEANPDTQFTVSDKDMNELAKASKLIRSSGKAEKITIENHDDDDITSLIDEVWS